MGMRRVIRFKPELLDLVLKGVKTSTVRPVNGAEYGPDLILTDGLRRVPAELLSVRQLSLSEAMRFYASEGFSSPEKFLENIKSIYPPPKTHRQSKLNRVQAKMSKEAAVV
jgi:hypothetical protein